MQIGEYGNNPNQNLKWITVTDYPKPDDRCLFCYDNTGFITSVLYVRHDGRRDNYPKDIIDDVPLAVFTEVLAEHIRRKNLPSNPVSFDMPIFGSQLD